MGCWMNEWARGGNGKREEEDATLAGELHRRHTTVAVCNTVYNMSQKYTQKAVSREYNLSCLTV